MIVLYTSPGCASCRKAKNYLKDNNIRFLEKNIFNVLLNPVEVKYLIKRTDNGTDDLISKRSKIIQENKIDIDSMSVDELAQFIVKNPSVLRRPIILDDKTMQIGYDSDEIGIFQENIERKIKKCKELCSNKDCSRYSFCGKLREEIN